VMDRKEFKIYVGMIVYNEEIFIEASLKSVYDHVDEIVIIDGSPWGPSTDNTVKIAQSLGPKVKITSGTWRAKGTDHKWVQRSEGLELMEKGRNNWCIVHDADEVWSEWHIKRLIWHLCNANEATMLFSYQWIHLFNDPWHRVRGKELDQPRRVGTFRLVSGVRYLNHHMVGTGKNGNPPNLNFQKLPFPEHVTLPEVMFFHYGQAVTKEKAKFKAYYYFLRDIKARGGYKSWEEYYKEVFLPGWETRMKRKSVSPYYGVYPKAVQPLIGTFWKRQ